MYKHILMFIIIIIIIIIKGAKCRSSLAARRPCRSEGTAASGHPPFRKPPLETSKISSSWVGTWGGYLSCPLRKHCGNADKQ